MKSFEPNWPMNIKFEVALVLFLIDWCLSSKHVRRSGKTANEMDNKWNVFEISKPYLEFDYSYSLCNSLFKT